MLCHLTSRTIFPRGGWVYRCSVTGWEISDPLVGGFDANANKILRYWLANPGKGFPTTTIEHARKALASYTYHRLTDEERKRYFACGEQPATESAPGENSLHNTISFTIASPTPSLSATTSSISPNSSVTLANDHPISTSATPTPITSGVATTTGAKKRPCQTCSSR